MVRTLAVSRLPLHLSSTMQTVRRPGVAEKLSKTSRGQRHLSDETANATITERSVLACHTQLVANCYPLLIGAMEV